MGSCAIILLDDVHELGHGVNGTGLWEAYDPLDENGMGWR